MLVKNRSTGIVAYTIPDLNVRRRFSAGETKEISQEELQALSYQPGGLYILQNYLQVNKENAEVLQMQNEPEYYLNEQEIKDLLLNGSLDAFLDALDFAPKGVIEMFIDMAVKLPISDTNKMKAIKDKTGFDVAKAIEFSNSEEKEESAAAPKRRVAQTEAKSQRRTPEYKVIS